MTAPKPNYLKTLFFASALLATVLINATATKVFAAPPITALNPRTQLTVVSAKQVHDNYLKNNNYILIDNRPEYKFRMGHLPGAVNLPYFQEGAADNVLNKELLMKTAKEKTIVFYCTGYDRAYNASRDAVWKWGVAREKVIWFRGGMREWVDEGYDVGK